MNMSNTPTYIFNELKRRKIPVELIDESTALMRYKHKGKWHLIKSQLTEDISAISRVICNHKVLAEIFAREVGLPVPDSERYENDEQALKFMKKHDAIVVKPIGEAHGHGITLNVSSKTALKKAMAVARKYTDKPLLQQMVQGEDLRIMLIDGKYTAAVRRVPASVTGDGKHSIKELIELENTSGQRSTGKRGRLKVISFDSAKAYLQRRLHRVPEVGEIVPVVGVSNTSKGGHAEDATDDVPKEIRKMAEAYVKHLKLPVCGLDIMIDKNREYFFIESNSNPGFGPHHHPRVGKERDVTGAYVDMLLKD